MKKLILITAALAFGQFAVAKQSDAAKPETFKVDAAASKVAWVGKKIGGQHNGTLAVKGGSLTMEGVALKGGEFTVDMTSIKVLDLTDPKYNGDLTAHLKSEDFFSADKHGEARFVIKSVTKRADGVFEAKGPMTIKGIAKDITIPLKVDRDGKALTATGKVTLDRTNWDIKYRSGKFFPNIGDKLIKDGFDIEVEIKAKA